MTEWTPVDSPWPYLQLQMSSERDLYSQWAEIICTKEGRLTVITVIIFIYRIANLGVRWQLWCFPRCVGGWGWDWFLVRIGSMDSSLEDDTLPACAPFTGSKVSRTFTSLPSFSPLFQYPHPPFQGTLTPKTWCMTLSGHRHLSQCTHKWSLSILEPQYLILKCR